MQNNNMEFDEDDENYKNSENDIDEQNRNDLQQYQNMNMNYLNLINNLKSPEYDNIISEYYENISLSQGDDDNDNNDIDENKLAIINELSKKLKTDKTSKEKKKRTNKVIKDGMGLKLSLDVTEPALLYHSYHCIINKKTNFNEYYFDAYLYSINISTINSYPIYGFIFPINIGQCYTIKLYNRKTKQIIYTKIKREKKLSLDKEEMKDIIIFHLNICNLLIRGKKNIDKDNLKSYEEALSNNEKYKKYFFVPISKNKEKMIIDDQKIDKVKNFSDNKFDEKYFPRISSITNIKSPKVIEKLKNSFLITDYKTSRMYKFQDILFKKDNINSFIDKYTYNNEELKPEIMSKLTKVIQNNNININKINAKFIMEDLYFSDEENNQVNEKIGGIIGYRKIPIKNKINLKTNIEYYLSCKFGPSNFCKQTNFIYNTNILKTNNEIQKEITPNIKDKEPASGNNDVYAKILPPDRVFCHYVEQKDIDFFEYIPSIFANLEEILKVWQFIKDNELTSNKTHDEKIFIEKNYSFLQWAFTFNEDVQDFNYETLETLGDSILKMLATTLVYHINELNDKETNVDKLVFGRKTLICNLHLFNKGKKSKIYNYIIKYPKEITNYFFPLEHENIKSEKINPSEKRIADIVESSIGGIFLLNRNLKDIFKFIIKLDIPYVEEDDHKYKETKGRFTKDAIWKEVLYKYLVEKSCKIMNKKLENFSEFIFPEKINDIIDINKEKIKNDVTFFGLMEQYLMKCTCLKSEFKGKENSLEYLQQCRIFYKFNDVKLLEQAMTHKSKNPSNSQNYEKLELLGDSIVEIFIAQYTFCLYSPYLFEDPNENIDDCNEIKLNDYEQLIKKNAKIFNNKFMTHVKSYLCSNYFMCKLSLLLGLPKLIQFSEKNINMEKQLKQFLKRENIENFLESPLNNYISTEAYQPKFIADLFEALIGAIYIDSDLKTTFEFLHTIYGPSICYSCLYLEELPFSIVADFTEKCSKELKIVPSFKNVSKEEIIKSGLEYSSNKYYLKLTIGNLFSTIDMGDSEEKAKENLSEKGMIFLENYISMN